MQKILIIGGCGYIGSKLFIHLTKQKYFVDTVDITWFGNNVNPNNIILDYKSLTKAFLKKYDVIILFAGHSSVAMCENAMIASFENNIHKFLTLLEKIDTQKFIYASSSGIYGSTGKRLMEEDEDRYIPTNYYDLTKKTIDYYAQLSHIQYYGLRFGTVNGGSPNLRTDLMINKMYLTSQKTGKIIITNKKVLRPILGIQDLCRAVVSIIEKEGTRGIYNIASFNSSVGEIATAVAQELKGIEIVDNGEKDLQKVYDFAISTEKFEKTFDFLFTDTVKSIIMSLQEKKKKVLYSERLKRKDEN
jgi:UDP-glucose 4-epimerase